LGTGAKAPRGSQIRAVAIACVLLFAGTAQADDIHTGSGQASVVSGRVVSELYYGPPGYGANPGRDEKIHSLVLLVDQPLSIPAGSGWDQPHADVRRIQLVVDWNRQQQNPTTLRNRPVTVEGELFEAYTPEHRSGVMMRVSGIELR
jgi:hypothetical protein